MHHDVFERTRLVICCFEVHNGSQWCVIVLIALLLYQRILIRHLHCCVNYVDNMDASSNPLLHIRLRVESIRIYRIVV